MAKPIPRIGSRRNGRISSCKSARKIRKGVIHVQASFNNTIVTVIDVRGVLSSFKISYYGSRENKSIYSDTSLEVCGIKNR